MATVLPDEDLQDLYDHAPCGYLSALPDGTIARVNQTFLGWSGYRADQLVDVKRFPELLTVAGRIYYETHYEPMLKMQGFVRELALDVVCSDGKRMPVLLNAVTRHNPAGDLCFQRITIFNATERREYERALLLARNKAEEVAQLQKELLAAQEAALRERSTLLIPVREDVLVMPLIGDIDPARGRQIFEALVQLRGATGVRAVVIDITGVPELDLAASNTLAAAARALRLRGVTAILTGIQPQVAARLVEQQIDLGGFLVHRTLAESLSRIPLRPSGKS